MGLQPRLPFEIDQEVDESLLTAHAGIPVLMELYRKAGLADLVDTRCSVKLRKRGLGAAEMVESLMTLWVAGGERCEDLERLREDGALAHLLGHEFPAPQTAREYLEAFHEESLPLWQGAEGSSVPPESDRLKGLAEANAKLLRFVQANRAETSATLDVDATILESDKRAARRTYQGGKGYQPVTVLWAEQDLIVVDEFRDGNVPAGSGNLRVVKKALEALPPGIERVRLRGDSALYEHALLDWLASQKIGFAVSADMSRELRAVIEALPEDAWQLDAVEVDAVRQWSEVLFVSDEQCSPEAHRYLAIRILKKQGALFADGTDRRHFAIVTNLPGDGLELIGWHRGKAGTIEHVHDILTNELAAEALPSQKFGANAAWHRLNVLLYNLLSALKRLALPGEFSQARPKRLRFLLFNTIGKVIRHARETLLRLISPLSRDLADLARLKVHALAGV
jgi:hypothetical protein